MRRTNCGACAGTTLDVFLNLGQTPLANSYPASVTERQRWYPLEVAVCGNCQLAQLMDVVDDAEIFGADYGFYSSGSPAQMDYHRRGFDLLWDRFGDEARRGTVEVACNDGGLLAHFLAAGCKKLLGIDPADGPAAKATGRGLMVIQESLTRELGEGIRKQWEGPAGLVIAYNCMAHVQDLGDVLDGIYALMDKQSVAVFEMQYLPDLLAGNMYDQIYHEHRYYYSLTSLRKAAELHRLRVIDAELIELQGGGLRVTLSTDKTRAVAPAVNRIMAAESWLPSAYASVQGRVDRTRDHLRGIIDAELAGGATIAGYAAAAKATTILNFCRLGPAELEYVLDTTPYKQGRFVPGTGVPIISPEDAAEKPTDALLLLASNYLGAALRSPHKGRWITPLPLPAVI